MSRPCATYPTSMVPCSGDGLTNDAIPQTLSSSQPFNNRMTLTHQPSCSSILCSTLPRSSDESKGGSPNQKKNLRRSLTFSQVSPSAFHKSGTSSAENRSILTYSPTTLGATRGRQGSQWDNNGTLFNMLLLVVLDACRLIPSLY